MPPVYDGRPKAVRMRFLRGVGGEGEREGGRLWAGFLETSTRTDFCSQSSLNEVRVVDLVAFRVWVEQRIVDEDVQDTFQARERSCPRGIRRTYRRLSNID